jgi:hypothetical protein
MPDRDMCIELTLPLLGPDHWRDSMYLLSSDEEDPNPASAATSAIPWIARSEQM